MDWSTFFPYTLIGFIILIAIGIYALITCKTLLRAVFGIELFLMAINLLLLSFGLGGESSPNPDPFAQTISIIIIVVGLALLVIGLTIDRSIRKTGESSEIEFNFITDGAILPQDEEDDQKATEIATIITGEET